MVKRITKRATTIAVSTFVMMLLFTVSVTAASSAAITFFMADSTTIAAGETVTFTLRTNSAANHVWAEVDGVSIPATMLDRNDRTGQVSWAVSARPQTSQTIRLNAGATNRGSDSNVQIPIVVTGTNFVTQTPTQPAASGNQRIYSVTEVPAIALNTISLEVVTGSNSNYAWVRFDGGRYVIGNLLHESNGQRTWQINYRPNRPNQRHTVQVSANHAYVITNAANRTVNIEIAAPFVPPVNPTVTSVQARPTSILAGRSTVLTVRTNNDVNYVWAMVDGSRVNARRTGETSTARTWTLTASPSATQTINVFGNHISTESGAATRSVNITVNHETATIRSAAARWNNAGTQVQVTVVTNAATEWVDLQVPGRAAPLVISERRNTGDNEITWTAIYTPQSGWHNVPIWVFAGDSNGGRDASRSINHIEGSVNPDTNIFSVSTPVITPVTNGNYEAIFTVVTSANTQSVFVRAIDTGNFDMTHVSLGWSNISQNQRFWTVVVPLSGTTNVEYTRFEIEAIGSGGVLPGGRHITGNIRFR